MLVLLETFKETVCNVLLVRKLIKESALICAMHQVLEILKGTVNNVQLVKRSSMENVFLFVMQDI